MTTKLRILLTGASGTVGLEVLKELCRQSHRFDITAFDLKSKVSLKKLSPYKDKTEIIYGNISKYDDIGKACLNKDVVIHLAAIIPPLADENPELSHKVNMIGTQNLVKNLELLSPKSFLLYSSSISVYGDRLQNPFIKIEDKLEASDRDEYAKTKIEAEQIIQKSKIDWSIFRLTAIMGNHKVSKLMFHMPLQTSLEIATPEDTARAFVNAIEVKSKLSKKIFNLGGGEKCRLTYEEFISRSFNIFGLGKLNFPNKTFAEKNFHCGYYADGNKLDEIVHFRNDTIASYFNKVKETVPLWRKIFTTIFRTQIKKNLLRISEPYKAFTTNDSTETKHYFNASKK